MAFGNDAQALEEASIAFGQDSKSSGNSSIAIGRQANATGQSSIAIGFQAVADKAYSVVIGANTYKGTTGNNVTGVGQQAQVLGNYSAAFGMAAQANKSFTSAIGSYAKATADNANAMGSYSTASADFSVALDTLSVADRTGGYVGLYAPDEDKDSLTWKANAGAVSVGSSVEGKEFTRQITNVAAGSADTDAVNVAQLNAVKAAAGKKVSLVDGENTKATLVKDDATGTQYKVDVDLSKYAKTEDVAVVYDQNKTSLRSTNASVAENAIALGKGASAVKDSVAIGNGASVVVGSNGVSGVALGNKAHAGYKGTSLGSNAISGREGTTLVGANTNSGSLYTTVVGTDSVINSSESSEAKYLGMVNVQGATATVVGSKNTVDNQNNKVYSGVANNIMGAANTIESSNGITIQGSGNTVTDAYKDMDIDSWGDVSAILGGDYSVLAGTESGDVAVIGGANNVSKQTDSTVIGYDNKLTGDNEKGSHDVFMAGSHNELTNVSDSIVMGNKNVITGVSNVISFGHQNEIKANNAVAIGNGAGVSVEGGVALGVGSVASTDAGALGYGADGKTDATWQATKGAVSVGGNGVTRQITNVAAGTEDTDAVNVAQLKNTNQRIDGVENQVISNSNRINQLGNRVNKVGAGAAALAALHPMDFDPDDKLTFSAGYGNYGGENAAAIGAYYRPDEKVMFSVAGTVGNGENMVNAGISFALDRTNHVSNSRTALAREVIDLRGQLAVMGAKMAKMEKALGMLDETKTKLFPDVPANHWAYEYIAKLAGNGYIEGYPDGNFGGDRLMTRYEFAAMLYRAIEKGAALEEKIIKEFEPELGRIRVDRISGEDGDRDKIERVRVNDTKGERDHYGNKLAK